MNAFTGRDPRAFPVWRLLREARQAAGFTQREVAVRAGTSQSAVARYETAATLPDLPTLQRLLLACGLRLQLDVVPVPADELRQLDESLDLTPRQRAERNRRVTALAARAAAARRAGHTRRLAGS